MNRQDPKDAMNDMPWHIIMDIEPDKGCPHCGCRKWGGCLVDTSQREDLFTKKIIPDWRGRSECKICGEVVFWSFSPDGNVRQRKI
jgi:hypothetical protein